MKKIVLFLAALICYASLYADDAEKYRAFADTIRAEVYSMDLPAFNTKEIPEKYRNESAVIKAIYDEINAKKKTGIGVEPGIMMLPMVSRRAKVEFEHLTRMLVHINDKAALEKYSEFDFGTDSKHSFFKGYSKKKRAMGARIIKPDGTIKDVDTSDFYEVTEGKNGEKKSRKLAIPGLEIGDDIDLFFYTESKMQNTHPDPVSFYLKDTSPILNYKIHCTIDDNLTTQYRTLNGAPDFNVSRDDDGNYMLDLEVSDIYGKEPRRWYNTERQSPLIKMYVFNRRNSEVFTPKSARKDGLQANPSCDIIIEDRWDVDDWWAENGINGYTDLLKKEIKDGGKILKGLEKMLKEGTITNQQAADYIYNLVMYEYLGLRDGMNVDAFAKIFYSLTNKLKLPVKLGFSDVSYAEPLDQAISLKNGRYFIMLEGETPRYYFPQSPEAFIIAPSEMSPTVQGGKATLWRKKKDRKKNPETPFFTIPVSSIDENTNLTTLNAEIEGQTLNIKRNDSYRGITKTGALSLISWEDIDNGYTDWLNRYGLNPVVKEKKKQTADREARYDEQRAQQTEDFKNEVEAYHGTAPARFNSGKITSLGIDPEHPELIYDLDYSMDNYVKRAGKNMVVAVGNLLSEQPHIQPGDRQRDDNIAMTAPRRYTTVINLAVPAGYKVNEKSLSDLEKSIKNKTGEFTVKTSLLPDGNVSVKINKEYSDREFKASEWNLLLEILDAASDWNSSSLILEKI